MLAARRNCLSRSLRRLAITILARGGEDAVAGRARVLAWIDRLLFFPPSPSPTAALTSLAGIAGAFRGRRGTCRALPSAVRRGLRLLLWARAVDRTRRGVLANRR